MHLHLYSQRKSFSQEFLKSLVDTCDAKSTILFFSCYNVAIDTETHAKLLKNNTLIGRKYKLENHDINTTIDLTNNNTLFNLVDKDILFGKRNSNSAFPNFDEINNHSYKDTLTNISPLLEKNKTHPGNIYIHTVALVYYKIHTDKILKGDLDFNELKDIYHLIVQSNQLFNSDSVTYGSMIAYITTQYDLLTEKYNDKVIHHYQELLTNQEDISDEIKFAIQECINIAKFQCIHTALEEQLKAEQREQQEQLKAEQRKQQRNDNIRSCIKHITPPAVFAFILASSGSCLFQAYSQGYDVYGAAIFAGVGGVVTAASMYSLSSQHKLAVGISSGLVFAIFAFTGTVLSELNVPGM